MTPAEILSVSFSGFTAVLCYLLSCCVIIVSIILLFILPHNISTSSHTPSEHNRRFRIVLPSSLDDAQNTATLFIIFYTIGLVTYSTAQSGGGNRYMSDIVRDATAIMATLVIMVVGTITVATIVAALAWPRLQSTLDIHRMSTGTGNTSENTVKLLDKS